MSLYLPSLAPQTGLCPLLDVLLHRGPQIARRSQSHGRLGPRVRGIVKIFIDLPSELPRDEDAGEPGGGFGQYGPLSRDGENPAVSALLLRMMHLKY